MEGNATSNLKRDLSEGENFYKINRLKKIKKVQSCNKQEKKRKTAGKIKSKEKKEKIERKGKMTREELIKSLSSVSLRAAVTGYDYDTGIHYDFIKTEGAGSGTDRLGEWPLFSLKGIEDEKWHLIQEKLRKKSLEVKDLEGTDLGLLAEDLLRFRLNADAEEISEVYKSLLSLPDSVKDGIYCICDLGSWDKTAEFYADRRSCEEAFEKSYCWDFVAWENMDDHELESWYKRLDEDLSELPFEKLD